MNIERNLNENGSKILETLKIGDILKTKQYNTSSPERLNVYLGRFVDKNNKEFAILTNLNYGNIKAYDIPYFKELLGNIYLPTGNKRTLPPDILNAIERKIKEESITVLEESTKVELPKDVKDKIISFLNRQVGGRYTKKSRKSRKDKKSKKNRKSRKNKKNKKM